MGKLRDARFDTLKGVLILLVVFGHFFGHSSQGSLSQVMGNFIYSFHMPLFVFISGYFTSSRKFLAAGGKLLEAYIIFQLIKGLYFHYTPLKLLIHPASMMWYLSSLLLWRVVYMWMSKKNIKVTWRLILSTILLSLVVGFIPWVGRDFALSRLIFFAPYFFLGVYFHNQPIIEVIKRNISANNALLVLAFVLLASMAFVMCPFGIMSVFAGADHYPLEHQWQYMVARFFSYATSAIVSIAIIRLCAFENATLGIIGKDSLKFYLFHGVMMNVMEKCGVTWSPLFAVIYAMMVSIAIYYFNKTKISDFAITPASHTIKGIKSIINNG